MPLVPCAGNFGKINVKINRSQPLSVLLQITVRKCTAPWSIKSSWVVIRFCVIMRSALTSGDLQCFNGQFIKCEKGIRVPGLRL